MSRTVRILTMTAGSALLFTLFAIAGWAITDQLASDDQAGEDTVAMFSYPLVPVQGDEESTLEWIEEQQAFTAEAMAGPNDPDAFLGDAIAGGQTIRVIPEISLPDTDVAETPPTTINDGGAAEPGSVSPEPGGGEVADGAIPGDLFADAPWLIDRIDLSDIVIFDGFLEPLDIDLCAGSDAVPSIPAGCPTGFGGTIVPLSGDLPASDDEVGGRPPTGLTAFGPDTLYVRTFRRSSVPEVMKVSARQLPPDSSTPADVCDPDIDPPPQEITSNFRRVTTIPIDTSGGPESWPYDPAFDTMDISPLALEPGTRYAICAYWIDSTGFTVVSYWQAMQVTTADANAFKVYFGGFRRDGATRPIFRVEYLIVNPSCGSEEWIEWGPDPRGVGPAPEAGSYELYEDRLICDFKSLSGIRQAGGFWVNITLLGFDRTGLPPELIPDGGNPTQDFLRSWVSVDRSLVDCRRNCRSDFVASVPMPIVEHDYWDPGGRTPIPPTLRSAGVVWLSFDFEDVERDGNRSGWIFGEPTSFDTSDRIIDPPPTLTLVAETTPATEMDPYRVGDYSYATARSFRVENTEPVSLEVEVINATAPRRVACSPPGLPTPSYENAALASVHTFQISGLCLGDAYWLRITATDAAGVRYYVSTLRSPGLGETVSPSDVLRAERFFFSTGWAERAYTYDVVAELQLGPLPLLDRVQNNGVDSGPFPTWVYLIGDLDVRDGPFGGTAAPPDQASVPFTSGWRYINYPGKTLYCNEQPYDRIQPSPLEFRVRDVEARENDNPILQDLRLKLHDWPNWYCGGPAPLVRSFDIDLSLSGNPSLTQLVEGVVITDGVANYPRLVVRAENIQWTRIGWTGR